MRSRRAPPKVKTKPEPLTTGSPVTGAPTLGQAHGLKTGKTRWVHDLGAEGFTTASPVIEELADDVAPAIEKRVRPRRAMVAEQLQKLQQEGLPLETMTTALIHRKLSKAWPKDKGPTPSRDTVARELREFRRRPD